MRFFPQPAWNTSPPAPKVMPRRSPCLTSDTRIHSRTPIIYSRSFLKRSIYCVAIGWDRQFKGICELLNRMPKGIPLIVGDIKLRKKWKHFSGPVPRSTSSCAAKGKKRSGRSCKERRPRIFRVFHTGRTDSSSITGTDRCLIWIRYPTLTVVCGGTRII